MSFVHQQRVEQAKTNELQSKMIEGLILTVAKQSMTNEQQLVTIHKQSDLIQRLQEETEVIQIYSYQ